MKKLVLLSGGMDSVTAAHYLRSQGVDVLALSVSCSAGGKGDREVKFARKVANELGIKHIVLDMSELGKCFRDKHTVYAVGGTAGDWVKCLCDGQRSAYFGIHTMITAAMMAAMENECSAVVWGVHKDDLEEHTRESVEEVIGHFNTLALLHAGARATKIEMPFIGFTKLEVAKLGLSLGVDLEETYSCSSGKRQPCGKCGQCQAHNKVLEQLDSEPYLPNRLHWDVPAMSVNNVPDFNLFTGTSIHEDWFTHHGMR